MLSFNNDPQLKDMLLEEVTKHEQADAIVQRTYDDTDENGKWTGCAVGCSVRSLNIRLGKDYDILDHFVYEKELGIPRILARLEDRIFEGLPTEEAKTFHRRFIEAVPVGKDLRLVWSHFAIWLLTDEHDGVVKFARTKQTEDAIRGVSDIYVRSLTQPVDITEWGSVRAAAATAAANADTDAAKYAAAAAEAAADAADAADAYAVYAYATAAAYATSATAAAYATSSAAAREKFYIRMSEKLLELIQNEGKIIN